DGHGLWDEEDGFFYDSLNLTDGTIIPLKVRSLVGLMPLLAVEVIDESLLDRMPDFTRRMHWFTENRPRLSGNMESIYEAGEAKRHITAIVTRVRLQRILSYMLDENEFLSEYGIRSLSKVHEA